MGVVRGNNLRSGNNSIWDLAVCGILIGSTFPMTRIDGDLDGNGTTTDLLALESVDSLLLFSLVTNIYEAVALAPLVLAPMPSNDAC